MSHIDEGTLHAYLDGALDLYPAGEADNVRQHLEACGECRRRLEEERAIRTEAETILAAAAPDVAVPPFEELRAEAARRGTPAQASGLSRMRRWAWAASVVLALGTGWMLRGSIGQWVSQPGPQEEAAQPSVAGPEEADAPAAVQAPSEGSAQGTDQAPAERVEPATLEDRAPQPPPVPVRTPPVEVAEEPLPATEAVAAVKELETEAAAGARAAPTAEERDVAAAGARRMEVMPSAADLAAPVRQGRAAAEADRLAEGSPLDSLVVPGLTFLRVLPVTGPLPGGSVVVQQLTETGDTVEVIGLPAGVEPPVVSLPAPEGWSEVVVLRGDAWVILRGRLPEAELLALGERLRSGG